jgi:hypothetical protein
MKFRSEMAWPKMDNLTPQEWGVLKTNKHSPLAQVRGWMLIFKNAPCSKGVTLHFTRRLDWWVDFFFVSLNQIGRGCKVLEVRIYIYIHVLYQFCVNFWVYKESCYIYNLQIKISPQNLLLLLYKPLYPLANCAPLVMPSN